MTSGEAAVHGLLQRAQRAGLVVGAAAAWGRDSRKLQTVVVGRAAVRPAPRQLTLDTWMDLASLTKPLITTTLALLAMRSGELRCETRVGEVLTETRGGPVGDLTVASLLSHTSGLPSWLPLYCRLPEPDRGRLLSELARIEPLAAPGRRVIYSCVGFILLGALLERVGEADLATQARDAVLRPLGLEEDLGFRPDPASRKLAAGATEPREERRLVASLGLDVTAIPRCAPGLPDDGNARFLGGVAGNAGLFGTARGVWRLAREFRHGGGELLRAEEAALATRAVTTGCEQDRALGWQMSSTVGCSAGPALPPDAVGHTGFTGVSVWLRPASGDCNVLLGNRVHPGFRNAQLHPLRRRFHALAAR
jgi:CubicO group peptidase (beta-lactamase class C family)